MSKILDLAKSFEQTSNEQAKDTEQVVATEFKKHEQRLIDLLNENEKAMNSAIQEQNKRLLPTMLKTWSIVAIAIVTALLLMWGILAYQSKKIAQNTEIMAQQKIAIQDLADKGQYQATGLHRQEESQTPMRSSEQGCRELEQWQSNDSDGVLIDDRIRKALARSLGTSTGTATAEGSRFTQDVRVRSRTISA